MPKAKKIEELESLVYTLELELKKTKLVLAELAGKKSNEAVDFSLRAAGLNSESQAESGTIIEGVFDGQLMVGPDGKKYSVPANYASKSKLVEGDILKLTIARDGTFIFKQISPVERKRIVGYLVKDKEQDEFVVLAEEKVYKVLMASITYFKGEEGDEVVILAPKDSDSNWAAVENIIKKPNQKHNHTDEFDIIL
ncbi:hypothetical protein C4566_01385 [Candidatus Parcubacteria bacterium]|nr:MAG: hypothetical protein C4566_01385 [Candidatus Parcubacteria bacterium]